MENGTYWATRPSNSGGDESVGFPLAQDPSPSVEENLCHGGPPMNGTCVHGVATPSRCRSHAAPAARSVEYAFGAKW